MDAWIDCLTYLDEGDGTSRFDLKEGEKLTINPIDPQSFENKLPAIYAALVECTVSVNQRYIDDGKRPLLNLVLK